MIQLGKGLIGRFLTEITQNETLMGVLVAIALTPVVAAYGKDTSRNSRSLRPIPSIALMGTLEERDKSVPPSKILREENVLILTQKTPSNALVELPADSMNIRLEEVLVPTGVGTSLDHADSHESLDSWENFWREDFETRSVKIASKKAHIETLTKESAKLDFKIDRVMALVSNAWTEFYLAKNVESPTAMKIANNPMFATTETMPHPPSCASLGLGFFERISELYLSKTCDKKTSLEFRIRELERELEKDKKILYQLILEKEQVKNEKRQEEIEIALKELWDKIREKMLDLSSRGCEVKTLSAKIQKFTRDLQQIIAAPNIGSGNSPAPDPEAVVWVIQSALLSNEIQYFYQKQDLIAILRQDIAELEAHKSERE